MVRNRHLARAISDMGFGVFRRLVDYKATAAGVQVVYAERWFPSSKLCSSCGAVCDDLPLSQRVYNCACGFLADRDLNAALNLSNYPRLNQSTGDSYTRRRRHVDTTRSYVPPSVPMLCGSI
jgi:putative transposase